MSILLTEFFVGFFIFGSVVILVFSTEGSRLFLSPIGQCRNETVKPSLLCPVHFGRAASFWGLQDQELFMFNV
jgi:hypothetical protein